MTMTAPSPGTLDNMLYATDPETGETYWLDLDEDYDVCLRSQNDAQWTSAAVLEQQRLDAAAARKAKMQVGPHRRDLRFRK